MQTLDCSFLHTQEFGKVVESEVAKSDIIPLFHNLANDEQVGDMCDVWVLCVCMKCVSDV